MRIRVLFFGMLKDVIGRSSEVVEVSPGSRLQDLFDRYAQSAPRLRDYESSVVLARNHEFTARETEMADGDEVAFLPPVSGGTGYIREIADPDTGNFFALTRAPIDVRAIVERLQRPEDGAIVDFEGIVRNNTKGRPTLYLDYECYEEMAVKMMASIGREIAAENAIGRIALVHRLGRMEIGEASVVVVVTAPHRKPAFAAALEGINRLKRLVPIWKKEYFVDGEVWVEGDWDDSVRPAVPTP
ncbi:MAG: molybdenum cofactor biosynthesis protein MoaE [Bryobacteraceae bacterium]